MKKYILYITMFIFTCLFSYGCMYNTTGMSPSNVPITAEDTYTEIGKTSGSAWGVQITPIFFSIPLCEGDPMGKAVDRAIENSNGNALVEMTSNNMQYFFYFITIYRTNVEATAVKYEEDGALKK